METEKPESWLCAPYSLIACERWSVKVMKMQINLVKLCVYWLGKTLGKLAVDT